MSDIIIEIVSETPKAGIQRLGNYITTKVAANYGEAIDPRVFEDALYVSVTDAT